MDLKINQQLKLQPISQKKVYTSYVAEKTKKLLTIAAPIYKGQYITFPLGQILKLWYPGCYAVYTFSSPVVGKRSGPPPLLILEYPTTFYRSQRRQFVRLQTLIAVSVELPESPQTSYQGHAINISAGGVYLVMEKKCKPGTVINLTLQKPSLPKILGKVLRSYPSMRGPGLWEWAVEFIDITEQEQDKIMKYIFAKQLELRRRGLL
ncbi:MAG: flagellar brake protein [Firmicutes bacterium]|nr:flagellar brake protein [Bacillota bacterium]